MALPGCNNEIARLVLLKHQPHRVNVFWRPAPVALNLDIAQPQQLLISSRDPARRLDNFSSYEPRGTKRRFVVEKNPGTRKQIVGFPVICDLPKRRSLGDSVGASRAERVLRGSSLAASVPETFARTGVLLKSESSTVREEIEWPPANSMFPLLTLSERFHRLLVEMKEAH